MKKELDVASFYPSAPEVPIWRYMDFVKLISLLEESGLYFAPISSFSDPYEGTLSTSTIKQLSHIRPIEEIRAFDKHTRWYLAKCRASCWHQNEGESEALWRIYSARSSCVAIKSKISKIEKQLPKNFICGEVIYSDFENEVLQPLKGAYVKHFAERLLSKRKSFEYEREVRFLEMSDDLSFPPHIAPPNAIFQDLNGEWNDTLPQGDFRREISRLKFGDKPPVAGRFLRIDTNSVIDSIMISPYTDKWEADVIQKCLERYNLTAPVERSTLMDAPA